jgi:phage head maturation protease
MSPRRTAGRNGGAIYEPPAAQSDAESTANFKRIDRGEAHWHDLGCSGVVTTMSKLPRRDQMLHRLADTEALAAPISYDPKNHTFDAVISKGSPVQRAYRTEVLRIAPDAVDLTRMSSGRIPLLDHHKQTGIDAMLGRLIDSWFERGALIGKFKFNQTAEGKKAEGMVARGEVTGISAGYRVDQWLITDEDGDVVDERDVRWDEDLTFTATRWQLFEASLVGVPADASAMVRSLSVGANLIEDIRARMACRVHDAPYGTHRAWINQSPADGGPCNRPRTCPAGFAGRCASGFSFSASAAARIFVGDLANEF